MTYNQRVTCPTTIECNSTLTYIPPEWIDTSPKFWQLTLTTCIAPEHYDYCVLSNLRSWLSWLSLYYLPAIVRTAARLLKRRTERMNNTNPLFKYYEYLPGHKHVLASKNGANVTSALTGSPFYLFPNLFGMLTDSITSKCIVWKRTAAYQLFL